MGKDEAFRRIIAAVLANGRLEVALSSSAKAENARMRFYHFRQRLAKREGEEELLTQARVVKAIVDGSTLVFLRDEADAAFVTAVVEGQ